MEFLKGALVAGLWGCLVSLVLAFLFVAMTISFFSPAWDGRAFVRGMILMPFVIGVWLVPISVFLGWCTSSSAVPCGWRGVGVSLQGRQLLLGKGDLPEHLPPF